MELWIRSQDKEILAKAENINIRCSCDEMPSLGVYYISIGNLEIAKYKTKERALEVLDEIQNILKSQMILSRVGKSIAETCDGTVYREPDEYDIKEVSTYVYEIPEE